MGHRRARRESCSGRCSPRRTASASSGARSGRRRTPRASALPAHGVARPADRIPRRARRCSSALTVVAGFAAPLLDIALRAVCGPGSAARRPASTPPAAPRTSRAVARPRARAVDLARRRSSVGSLRLRAHGAIAGVAACCPFTAAGVYNAALRGHRAPVGASTTSFTQRGSLPVYVGTIFVVLRRRRGHRAARRRRVAGAARRLPDPDAAASSRRS